jgi:hypothetical protein
MIRRWIERASRALNPGDWAELDARRVEHASKCRRYYAEVALRQAELIIEQEMLAIMHERHLAQKPFDQERE